MTDHLTDEAVKALAHRYRFAADDHERTIAKTAEALLAARADAEELRKALSYMVNHATWREQNDGVFWEATAEARLVLERTRK